MTLPSSPLRKSWKRKKQDKSKISKALERSKSQTINKMDVRKKQRLEGKTAAEAEVTTLRGTCKSH